jgi:hypothetical protein
VPQSVFDSIRFAVNSVIKAEDVLSTASIANVQALLILSMVGDSHSQFVPNALSALWIRLGTAIRMVGFCVVSNCFGFLLSVPGSRLGASPSRVGETERRAAKTFVGCMCHL